MDDDNEPLVHVVTTYYAECMDCGWVSDETEDESTASTDARQHKCEE